MLLADCESGVWSSAGSTTTFYEYGIQGGDLAGQCIFANPLTGSCSCPQGTQWAMVSGQTYHYQPWDGVVEACIP